MQPTVAKHKFRNCESYRVGTRGHFGSSASRAHGPVFVILMLLIPLCSPQLISYVALSSFCLFALWLACRLVPFGLTGVIGPPALVPSFRSFGAAARGVVGPPLVCRFVSFVVLGFVPCRFAAFVRFVSGVCVFVLRRFGLVVSGFVAFLSFLRFVSSPLCSVCFAFRARRFVSRFLLGPAGRRLDVPELRSRVLLPLASSRKSRLSAGTAWLPFDPFAVGKFELVRPFKRFLWPSGVKKVWLPATRCLSVWWGFLRFVAFGPFLFLQVECRYGLDPM